MGYAFRPETLGSFLGIGENQPLIAGQSFTANIPENYANSGESQALSQIFGAGRSPEQQALLARQQAIAPAVASYQARIPQIGQQFQQERAQIQGEVEPLKQRYQAILDELKRKEGVQTQTAQTAASQEFGRRGIPASSTAYADYLAGKVNPIQSEYANLQKSTGLEQESGLRNLQNMLSGLLPQQQSAEFNITNALAQLQAGAGSSAIDDAFRQLAAQESQRQFNQQQTLAQQKFDFEKTNTAATDLSKDYATLGEGQSLFNLKTGQNIFTNPKTYKAEAYKAEGGAESDELQKIFGKNTGVMPPSYFSPIA